MAFLIQHISSKTKQDFPFPVGVANLSSTSRANICVSPRTCGWSIVRSLNFLIGPRGAPRDPDPLCYSSEKLFSLVLNSVTYYYIAGIISKAYSRNNTHTPKRGEN